MTGWRESHPLRHFPRFPAISSERHPGELRSSLQSLAGTKRDSAAVPVHSAYSMFASRSPALPPPPA